MLSEKTKAEILRMSTEARAELANRILGARNVLLGDERTNRRMFELKASELTDVIILLRSPEESADAKTQPVDQQTPMLERIAKLEVQYEEQDAALAEERKRVAELESEIRAAAEATRASRLQQKIERGRTHDVENEQASAAWANKLWREVERGRAKFPKSRHMLFALIEEVGELAGEMLYGTEQAAAREAIQVAAVAVRIAEEGDATKKAYLDSATAKAMQRLGECVRLAMHRRPTDAREEALNAIREVVHLAQHGDRLIATIDAAPAKP